MTSSCGSSTPAIRRIALGRDRDDRPAACLGFLHVADHLLEDVIVGRDGHHRHLLVDERDRSVLHLARRIAFGVDVGNLLQLQRALERDRVVDAAAEEQEIGTVVEPLRDLFRSTPSALIACSSICGICSSSVMCSESRAGVSVPRTCAM